MKLENIPKYEELNDYYGDPHPNRDGSFNSRWYRENITLIEIPYKMRLSWDPGTDILKIPVHRKIADVLLDALQEIERKQRWEYLTKHGYDIFAGTFNVRWMRGSEKWSTHTWAISIDLNDHWAPYRKKDESGFWVNNQPSFITDAFIERGFVTFPWDGMHFQACA